MIGNPLEANYNERKTQISLIKPQFKNLLYFCNRLHLYNKVIEWTNSEFRYPYYPNDIKAILSKNKGILFNS